MSALRRLSILSLILGVGQVVFGAIVRITGSGLGCGDHWPKCLGHWFPPLDRFDLIIEVTHRYIAATLSVAILALLVVAFLRRSTPGVGGRGVGRGRAGEPAQGVAGGGLPGALGHLRRRDRAHAAWLPA